VSRPGGKYLIVNADDYGVCGATNRAVEELFDAGLLSSASLMAVAPGAEQAARVSGRKGYPVGIHLTINSDSAENLWHSLTAAPSLGGGAGLPAKMSVLALKARSADVSAEIEAQYRFLCDSGCVPDHADNHCATLYGVNGRLFFINAFDFCAAHHLPFRFPKNPGFIERQLGRKLPGIGFLHGQVLAAARRRGVLLLDDMISNPCSIRIIGNYESLRGYYLDALNNIGEGITELFFHPSYPAGEAPSEENDEWRKRELELRFLQSGDLHAAAAGGGIKIVSWAQAFGNGGK